MNDQNTPSEPVAETLAPESVSAPALAPTLESTPAPAESESSQPNGSTPTDLPPVAPESPINAPTPIPVESQNGGVNEPESDVLETSIPEPIQLVPTQLGQTSFIRALLAKANAKIQSKRQKKLDLLMQSVSQKGKINNREAQKLLRISDKTAERYLNKLVTQGRLKRSGAGRNIIYMLPR